MKEEEAVNLIIHERAVIIAERVLTQLNDEKEQHTLRIAKYPHNHIIVQQAQESIKACDILINHINKFK